MANDYSSVLLPFRKGEVYNLIGYYNIGRRKCRMELFFQVLSWPAEGCSLESFGSDLKAKLLDQALLKFQHQLVRWQRFVFYPSKSTLGDIRDADGGRGTPFLYLLLSVLGNILRLVAV